MARDDDWDRRLGGLSASERWGVSADSLRSFVSDLRTQLGHPAATRSWAEWAAWSNEQLDLRLGRHTIERLAEPEYRAYEALTGKPLSPDRCQIFLCGNPQMIVDVQEKLAPLGFQRHRKRDPGQLHMEKYW